MKPERAFVAERPVAQHCAELLRGGPDPAELVAALERAGRELARLMPLALYPLLGAMTEVTCGAAVRESFEMLSERHPPLAANVLMTVGATAAPVLSTIEAGAVLALVDRAFGGSGEPPASLPAAFTLSADLMIQQLESLIAGRLALALGLDETAVLPLRRDGALAELAPFAAGTALASLCLTVHEESRAPWTISLFFALDGLAGVVGQGAPASTAGPRTARSPLAMPYADLPLPLRAVLVDMALPLAKLEALEVGQVLPISVARAVPLQTGEATIAHGVVGAEDDRVAVQITKIS